MEDTNVTALYDPQHCVHGFLKVLRLPLLLNGCLPLRTNNTMARISPTCSVGQMRHIGLPDTLRLGAERN